MAKTQKLKAQSWHNLKNTTGGWVTVGTITIGTKVALAIIMSLTLTMGFYQAKWAGLEGDPFITEAPSSQDAQEKLIQTKTTIIESKKPFWNWLIFLDMPLSLLALGIWFKRQQRQASQVQQEMAADEAREAALQLYFDRISALLSDNHLLTIADKVYASDQGKKVTPDEQTVLKVTVDVIRARTLDLLRRLEADRVRKSSVIRFLIETKVIRKAKLSLSEADLSEVDLRGADLSGADLNQVNLRGANLNGADLNNAFLKEANLGGAYLNNASLSGADLSSADLSRAFFAAADLSDANLSFADINDADFYQAHLNRADLSRVDANGANFKEADCSGANFQETDCSRVDFSGADLSDANLKEAKLDTAKLCQTQLPSDFN
ncbi:MAG: pentapeptide repeat-containing protein [Leptolyngbya sp. SIO1D8]|nr:pentapeptide repeat-containing protein [Leptolyngbya sp. SIO1D8]